MMMLVVVVIRIKIMSSCRYLNQTLYLNYFYLHGVLQHPDKIHRSLNNRRY